MICCTLQDKKTQQILLDQVRVTETAWERMKGLLGSNSLGSNDGLIISPCNSVHTLFMKYAIDVIYLDKYGMVKKIVLQIKPWHFSMCFGSATVLELASGKAEEINLLLGQQLQWNKCNG